VELGFRTSFPDNFLRPVARGANAEEAEGRLAFAVSAIRAHLGALIYSERDETMEEVVGQLLRERATTIASAESCTGGTIAQKLTDVPGSSDYVVGGVVAYADSAKVALLGVPEALLEEYGAVSEPVAIAMAEGARERFGSDFAVSTTGISGPGGGSETKPVGLVCIALAREGEAHAESFVFPLDRTRHRALTSQVALDWVRRALLGVEIIDPSLMRQQGGGPPPSSGSASGP
jgi:nicotinamide-nucleotide amidase